MKTILVTGAAGFLGFHTARALLIEGHQIIGLDSLNEFYNPHWKEENLDVLLDYQQFRFVKADIRARDAVTNILRTYHPEVIFHFAAEVGNRQSLHQPFLYTEVNVNGTVSLLELARQHGVKHFILASSAAVYGEKHHGLQEEPHAHDPVTPYGASKKSAEVYCRTYANLYPMQTSALRLSSVYGPAGRPDMVTYLFAKALLERTPVELFGDGHLTRDFVYIDDAVQGILATLNLKERFNLINIGSGQVTSMNELINTLQTLTGKRMLTYHRPATFGDYSQGPVDITKAQRSLEFHPTTPLEKGLEQFIIWYQGNRL